jgi:polysaccharide pyruvyl transferase WcaK-like protein
MLKHFKKVNRIFSFFQNEWGEIPWAFHKKKQFLNPAFAGSQAPHFLGNHYLLPFEFLAVEAAVSGFFKGLSITPEAPIILQVSQPIGLTREQIDTCLEHLNSIADLSVILFVSTGISGEGEIQILDRLARLLFRQVYARNAAGDSHFQIVIEVNAANYLFADDLQLALSKWFSEKPIWLAHPEYFEKVSAARNEAHFHVRNFFDALSRNKSLGFPWRNYYHRFALGELGAGKALYSSFALEKTTGIAIESQGAFGHENSITSRILLPNMLFNPHMIPPVGFTKLLDIAWIMLRNKFRAKPEKTSFEALATDANKAPNGIKVKQWRKVLITGWYGTETQGDKAILGEVLHFIKSAAPDCKVVLTTLHKGISEQTNKELNDLKGVVLVELDKAYSPALIREMDAVVVGGGPLMESASMKHLGYIFAEAFRQGKDRVIFGCGVGPIHSKEVEDITRYMLHVCQAGFLRDKESYDLAGRLYPSHVLKFACDPAVGFVSRWRRNNNNRFASGPRASIATLLRANTNEFSPESDAAKLQVQNEALAGKAARTLDLIAAKSDACFELLHMNAPWVGGDDRMYNRILAAQLSNRTSYHLVREYLTFEEHMERLAVCQAGFAMRYHGHIFCLAMGIPFVSLDYTGKTGKVSSLVNRIGYANRSYQWDALEPEKLASDFADMISNGKEISQYLIVEADKLVALLNHTYVEVFNYSPEK